MMYKEDTERRQMAAKPEINTTAVKTAYDAVVDAFTTDLQLVKGLAKVTNIAPDAVRMHNKKDRPDHRADLRYGLKDIGNYMTDVEMQLFIAWASICVEHLCARRNKRSPAVAARRNRSGSRGFPVCKL